MSMRLWDDPSARHLDRFGLLLAVTVAAIALLGLLDFSRIEDPLWAPLAYLLVNGLVAATFLLAIRASGLRARWVRAADVLVGLGLVLTALYMYVDLSSLLPLPPADLRRPTWIFLLLALLSPLAVGRRLVCHRRVNRGTMLGAISAYLLIALASTLVFLTVDSVQATPFFGEPQPTTAFMYFSLTTLTTAGLGDLAPVTPLSRMLTGLEAIVGQVYLVTFVAMIVALYVNAGGLFGSMGTEEGAETQAPAEAAGEGKEAR